MLLRRIAPTMVRNLVAMRVATTTTTGTIATNNANNNNNNRNRNNLRDQNLPPAFDVMHPDNVDLAKGYLGRISFSDNTVYVAYMKQVTSTAEVTEGPPKYFDTRNRLNVPLTPLHFGRVLAVLEGMADRCEIATRTSQGTFAAGPDPHTFSLKCVTTLEQQQPVEWTIDFDAAHSLMLHRFLREALQCSQGFSAYRTVDRSKQGK